MGRWWLGRILAAVTLSALLAAGVFAHPGSGIVVDHKGKVYFQGGRAVWMIDASGRLTKYSDKLGGHWMTLDPKGRFARADLKLVERITPSGAKPALLVADGGAPVAVGGDGNLYYGLRLLERGGVECGITRSPQMGSSRGSHRTSKRNWSRRTASPDWRPDPRAPFISPVPARS
jgi:hypothetical protein